MPRAPRTIGMWLASQLNPRPMKLSQRELATSLSMYRVRTPCR